MGYLAINWYTIASCLEIETIKSASKPTTCITTNGNRYIYTHIDSHIEIIMGTYGMIKLEHTNG